MTKVGLIYPPSPFLINQKAFPPLGILYLSAYLRREGVNVEVIDLTNKENCLEEVLQNLNFSVVGLSSTTPQYPLVKKIKDIIKRNNPSTVIVIGGAHASSNIQRCIDDAFDVVVVGEGERALLDIIHKHERHEEIQKVIRFPYIENLDSVPFPARDMIKLHDYGYEVDGGKATTIITSRGCPYECAFCSKDVWSRGVRFHGIEYVVEEIRLLSEKYGFRHLLFLDDLFTMNKKRLLAICERIKNLGLKWRCYVRANNMTKEMLTVMKEAGCVEVGVGVESGSQKILDVVDKGTKVEDNTRLVLDCKEVGIAVNVFLMIGLPGETYETVEETRMWMEKVRPDKFGFNIFAPYSGTPIYNNINQYDLTLLPMSDEKSWVKGKDGEHQAYVETNELKAEEILRLFKELFQYYTQLCSWKPGVGTVK